jgi:hypothetical protein
LSTAHQQSTIIEQRRLQNTNPRKQFIEDFIYQFEDICNNPNNYILFVLDANANVNEDTNGIKRLFTKCNMIDIYTHKHDDYEEFGTQERGSKRIDYMFGSRNILQYITNVGYPPFNEAFDSDHRAIFADISHTIMPIPTIEKRIRLVGTNSTNIEGDRYVRHLYNSLIKDNVFERVRILFEQSIQENPDIDLIMGELNELDELITIIMLKSEASTCSLKDRVYWSPEIHRSNLIVQYWNIFNKSMRQKINCIKRLDTTGHNCIKDNNDNVHTALKQSINNHDKLVKNHKQLRLNHLQTKVDYNHGRGQATEKLSVEKLLRRERKRQDHAFIRHTIKSNKSTGIHSIEIPVPGDEVRWETITDPEQIEKELLNYSFWTSKLNNFWPRTTFINFWL